MDSQEVVEELMWSLAKQIKGTVDLRAHLDRDNYLIWAVMVPLGNVMRVVPGTLSHSVVDSLSKALTRWEERSPENPF